MKLFGSRTKKTVSSAAPSTAGSLVDLHGSAGGEMAPGLCNLYSPQVNETAHVRDIADVLLEAEKLTAAQFDQIRQEELKKGDCDIDKLIRALGVSPEDILQAKAGLYGFEFRKITPEQVDRAAFDKLPSDYIKTNHVMPIALTDGVLVVATSRPANVFAFDDVKRQTNLQVRVVVCTETDIEAVYQQVRRFPPRLRYGRHDERPGRGRSRPGTRTRISATSKKPPANRPSSSMSTSC